MSGIAIFNSAVKQLQSSQKNLQTISEARKKLEQEQEMFGLKKKKAELDLEVARKEGRMTDLQADVLEAQHKTYTKQEEDKMKGNIASIKLAQQSNTSIAEKAMQWAKIGYKSDPQGVTSFLQARDRNAQRTQELRPKMSYGKIGYETVNVAEEEADAEDKASIRESRSLDIQKKKKELESGGEEGYTNQEIALAKSIADEDRDYKTPFETKLKAALPKARNIVRGKGKIEKTEYDAETEARIERNVKGFNGKKTREEIIQAMKAKGLIK